MKLYNEQSCKLVHPWDAPYKNNSYPYGQNLARFKGDPSLVKYGSSNATQEWVNEKAFFTYKKFPAACTNSDVSLCGHYTQVSWTAFGICCLAVPVPLGSNLWPRETCLHQLQRLPLQTLSLSFDEGLRGVHPMHLLGVKQ